MDSIQAKLHSDPRFTNNSLWRVWYATNGTTAVTPLGAVPVNSITATASGTGTTLTIVTTDANYLDGNILRVGDTVSLLGTGADSKFSFQDAQIVGVNVGASIVVSMTGVNNPTGSGTAGTLYLRNRVRKVMFAGFTRATQTANTGAVNVGPTFGSITLPIPVASGATVTFEDPAGSSFYLSDWSYKLATINDTILCLYK
jgi:hypothetical protein